MNLVIFAGNGGSGGLKSNIKGVLNVLSDLKDTRTYVICTPDFRSELSPYISPNLSIHAFASASRRLKNIVLSSKLDSEIYKFVYEIKPAIVFYFGGVYYKELLQFRTVIGMHNQLYIESRRILEFGLSKQTLSLLIMRHYTLKCMQRADLTIFESADSLQKTIDKGLKVKKGVVAHYGIAESNIAVREKVNLKNSYTFLYISTVFPYKNQIQLLNGLKILKERGYDFVVHLVGSGPEKWEKNLRAAVRKLQLNENVIMHGWVDHSKINEMIDNCDVYLYASSIETSGLGLLEGMARGAVIASNNESCMAEILSDGGILFDVYNPTDIADKLEMLLNNAELRKRFSERATEIAKKYTWKKHVDVLINEFNNMINQDNA